MDDRHWETDDTMSVTPSEEEELAELERRMRHTTTTRKTEQRKTMGGFGALAGQLRVSEFGFPTAPFIEQAAKET